MISYIELENFKSFDKILLDLRGKGNKPKKLALIYGENGVGKSNLISSIFCLTETFYTLLNQEKIKAFNSSMIAKQIEELDDNTLKHNLLTNFIRSKFFSLQDIIEEYMPIHSDRQIMSIHVGFYLNGEEGEYTVKFLQNRVIYERLTYLVSQRTGTIFELNENEIFLSPSIFHNTSFRNELLQNIEKFWGNHTLASILFNEKKMKNKKYISDRVDKKLFDVLSWFNTLLILYKNGTSETSTITIPFEFIKHIESGSYKRKK